MPYFTWQGITLLGTIKQGALWARTPEELSTNLLQRDIAILKYTHKKIPWWYKKISINDKATLFEKIASLLDAGIMLPTALDLISKHLEHIRMQELVYALTDSINAGFSLYQALSRHPSIFSPLMINVTHIGEETGRLASTSLMLYVHLNTVETFRKKMYQAIAMPAITALVFIIIAMLLLIWIVPFFATIFNTMNSTLPTPTRFLLYLSNKLQGKSLAAIVISIGIITIFVRTFLKSNQGIIVRDKMALSIPSFGKLLHDYACFHVLRSLEILTHAGIPIHNALHIALHSVDNKALQPYGYYLEQTVHSGESLSQSMKQHPEQWFTLEAIAMIRIGEESGKLPDSLKKTADYYSAMIEKRLAWYTHGIQPLLMIVLGLLIAFFICAIYMPLFNLGNMV